ncbi:T9SS type A sorting domain-containing protein [Flavobacterium nackdongense]|uniref:T9SS type A sorting domain-containing protein n=1 Tax=Flavobacterium nackdongense TaxID=2547394 RepID=A0A4P6YEJ1_9FLAO|nr:T9SS type A sorting domain-containing protein [Flavobacterium nackdongense]QBN19137.1 T9SS type A sorting domain-containing protein [Flavobacterium nackdongense]
MKIFSAVSARFTLALFGLLILGNAYSQNKTSTNRIIFGKEVKNAVANPTNGKIRCISTEYEQFLQEKNPQRSKENQFESWLAPLAKKQMATRTNAKTAAVITIPVVVHIIHSGQAIGTAPNISDAQVESQIAVLNQDYRRQAGTPGFNANLVGADVEIEFVLAKVDPNGNPTNGIERINFAQPSWEDVDLESTVKPATIWDPNQYLNMWTVKFTDNTLLGYAQFPDSSTLPGISSTNGAANTDGVVASFDVFGSNDFGSGFILAAPYNKGRTMSHEVGHFLGLRHIWGDGNGDESTNKPDCTATDYCADTPQVGWEHYSCGTYDTCAASTGNDMPENYMDYTNDTCMNIFTTDQKTRITTVMANSPRRVSLKTSTKGTAIPLFANDAELQIEKDYSLVNVSDCASLPAPTNKKITLSNRGTTTLTVVTINYAIAGGTNQVQAWTGSLAPNQSTMVTLLNTASYGILTASIGTTNSSADQRASNNTDTEPFSPVNYNFTNYVFNLQQDFYGSEITWDLKDKDGIIIYSGGPYTDKPSEILPLPALITQNWTLANNQCYTFTIQDSQADGICCLGGNGFYNIKSAAGSTTIASGASYGQLSRWHFTTNTLGTTSFDSANDIYLYPNPTKDYINLNIPSEYGLPKSLTINNSLGQIISRKEVAAASDLSINTSALSKGVYFIIIDKDSQTKTLQFIKE